MFVRLLAIVVLLLASCEKTSHDSIDKWTHTEKGTEKLKKTFTDESIDIDLSAHAGANLVKKGLDPEIRVGLQQMSPGRRAELVAKLAPRLWEIARLEGEMQMPAPPQVMAKDALITLRKFADDKGKQQIDTYLVDWY